MRKLFDVLGTQVLSIHDGVILGRICDIVIEKDSLLKIVGFLVEPERNAKKRKMIPWYDIRFNNDVCICSLRREPLEVEGSTFKDDSKKSFLQKDDLLNLEVFTTDGVEVGLLTDLLLSEEEGLIEGIQCSDGLIHDLVHGRPIYPLIGRTQIAQEVMLIGKEALDEAITRS